jgi:tRNA A-37 threonylcarbamoyl transferase component Bud32
MKAGLDTRRGPEGEARGASKFIPPPPAELAKFFPQLEIIELLGQGGMGTVYKARQPALGRVVALKILPAKAADDPGFEERFKREARALAGLNHPNIVAVYDFGEAGEMPYFIMEFMDGATLREVVRAGKLSPREALQIVGQICEALQFAHDEGVVHRDIKPENILLDKKGRVKIADFGIAKILDQEPQDVSLTGAQGQVGTPHYMAPEQIERPHEVDHRADIYSLGVVFYEMLTGELPLGRFAPPSRKAQMDARLDEVVLRALEKEPERRYQHASEVKTAVESVGNAATRKSEPVSSGTAVSARRSRLIAAVAGLGLFLLLGVAMLLRREHWPYKNAFVLAGRVVDEKGGPIPGASVRVNLHEEGGPLGTVLAIATNTDSAGGYLMQFDPRPDIRHLQDMSNAMRMATVIARKSGYYETSLGRKGRLLITERALTPAQEKRFAGVLKQRQIYTIDFELKPGAMIEGVLVNESDRPLRNCFMALSGLVGNRESIFRTAQTDAQGHFAFDGVPPEQMWRLQLGVGEQPGARFKSSPIAIATPKTYSFLLKKAGSESLELASMTNSARPGK